MDLPDGVLLPVLGVLGLVVGSFLDRMIVRVPAGIPVLRPGPRCPRCERALLARDRIPLVSWVWLRGRCRWCREPIPVGHPLVEAANALLWILAGLRFGSTWDLLAYAPLFSVLLVLTVIDAELLILPNRITYPAAVASFLGVVPLALTHDDPIARIVAAWASGIGYGAFLWILMTLWVRAVGRDGLGGGDVKLAPTLGVWLGYVHPFLVVLGILAASLLGTIVGALILIVRRRNEPFPFGPWMALGTIAVLLASRPLLALQGAG